MTKASDNIFPKILVVEGTAPASPSAGDQALFIDSADHKLKRKNSSGSVTDIESGGGIADQGTFTYLDATGASAPGTPASGKARIYAKTDGRIYSKDDAGVEYGPFDATGGAGSPLLVEDAVALDGTYGDDFTDASLTGWTTGGTVSASVGATTGYDATTIDLAMPAQSDRIYRTYPGDGKFCYLNVPRITQEGGMLALCFVDNSGNGTGFSIYNDGNAYLWAVTSNAYNSTAAGPIAYGSAGTMSSRIYRLSRSSTTVTGAISYDGGDTWHTITRTDATTYTRVMVARLHTTGGTGCILGLARFNVV